jgi:hypothetical protein
MKRLRAVIYGQAGVGKTTIVETAPGPRLILDSEGGADWLEKPYIVWNRVTEPPPLPTEEQLAEWGNDYSVVLFIRDWSVFEMAYAWLESGKHNFRTLALDSLTDIQKRCKDSISTGAFDMQAWGVLLSKMDVILRGMRDLTNHATRPLQCIIITALVRENSAKMLAPKIQGGLVDDLPGLFDLVGYYKMSAEVNVNGEFDRLLMISPAPTYEAKARGSMGRTLKIAYGTSIKNPDIRAIMRVLNPKPVAAPEIKEEANADQSA